ncbi:MAG: hypothetical protein PUP92_35210, partial [Rhizonema sp. PD38]|nr:hypothetical protein [Rhizonema sp. PD38]
LYSPEIASVIGRTSATILNQIDYWTNTKSGRIIDGIRWFYKTYEEWASELQISISTVRRAIAHLKETGIILVKKQSKKNCYHANWYTWNTEFLSLSEQIETAKMNTSICSFWTHLNIDFLYRYFSTSNSTAAESEKSLESDFQKNEEPEEVNWDSLKSKIEKEQSELADKPPNSNDHQFQDNDPHEDNSSAALTPKKNNRPATKHTPIAPEKLLAAIAEAKTIKGKVNFRMNAEIEKAIAKHFQNVYPAIAFVKEQIRLNVPITKSCEALFMWALKTPLDSKYDLKEVIEYRQPSEKDKADIAIALDNGFIRKFEQQPDGLWVVDTGKECLCWYDFLNKF